MKGHERNLPCWCGSKKKTKRCESTELHEERTKHRRINATTASAQGNYRTTIDGKTYQIRF